MNISVCVCFPELFLLLCAKKYSFCRVLKHWGRLSIKLLFQPGCLRYWQFSAVLSKVKKIHLCHQLLIISAILHRRYFQRFLSPRGSWEENNITFLHKHHPSNARNCNEKVIQSNLTSKHDESEREGKQSIETTLLPFTDIVWCLFLSDKVSPFHVCIVFSCKWFIPSKW